MSIKIGEFETDIAKYFYCINKLQENKQITIDQKGLLKDCIIINNDNILKDLEKFSKQNNQEAIQNYFERLLSNYSFSQDSLSQGFEDNKQDHRRRQLHLLSTKTLYCPEEEDIVSSNYIKSMIPNRNNLNKQQSRSQLSSYRIRRSEHTHNTCYINDLGYIQE